MQAMENNTAILRERLDALEERIIELLRRVTRAEPSSRSTVPSTTTIAAGNRTLLLLVEYLLVFFENMPCESLKSLGVKQLLVHEIIISFFIWGDTKVR